MAKQKEWRVKEEYDGKVALESVESRVVLSNTLSQEQLAKLAENRLAAGFLERTSVTEKNDVTN